MVKITNKKKKPISKNFSGDDGIIKRKLKPLVEHQRPQKWYEYQFAEVREGQRPDDSESQIQFQKMQKRAKELLNRDTEKFAHWYRTQNCGYADWLQTITHKGTFADKLSALQLTVQRSPVHALSQIKYFVEMVQNKGAKMRQSHTITQALKELFLDELLPPDRKLLSLNQRPLERYSSNAEDVEKRLILWQFEAQLKSCYRQFVESLQTLAGNMVEGVAQSACQEIAELLSTRPEQEQFLLSALVNKLGHPQNRVGAKVAQMLEKLVHTHPNMRLVVVKEVEQMMFRKNISIRAQRYGLHFLSRLLLVAGEFELAVELIQIYLRMFRILIVQDALNEHRLLSLLVTGLNRAFPYAKSQDLHTDLLQEMDSLYTIVQTAKLSTAISILRLLFIIHNRCYGLTDRFYCAFYRRLNNSVLNNGVDGGTSGGLQQETAQQLLELIQRVLKNDLVETRVRAFLKRLFQLALASNSAFAAATLLACHAVIKERPHLLRLDTNLKMNTKMDDWDAVDESESDDCKPSIIKTQDKMSRHSYDPSARNPLFAGADFALDTELDTLARHYHPTVAVFARALIRGEPIHYKSDPLIDLSHKRFLDRFAFKNPKMRHNKRQLLPDGSGNNDGQQQSVKLFAHTYTPSGVKAMNPMSQDYVSKRSTEIPVEERFLHHYAALKFRKNKMERDKKRKSEEANGNDDDEADEMASINSDEFDILMEKFEPGETRGVFDVDFAAEFGQETDPKRKQKSLKRRRADSDGEDSENDDEEEMGDDDEEEEDGDDEMDGSLVGSDYSSDEDDKRVNHRSVKHFDSDDDDDDVSEEEDNDDHGGEESEEDEEMELEFD